MNMNIFSPSVSAKEQQLVPEAKTDCQRIAGMNRLSIRVFNFASSKNVSGCEVAHG